MAKFCKKFLDKKQNATKLNPLISKLGIQDIIVTRRMKGKSNLKQCRHFIKKTM